MAGRYERRAWTAQEDAKIVDLVKIHGIKRWSLIADKLEECGFDGHRTGKQCRTR